MLILEMLSLNSLRVVCSSRALFHSNWPMTNRQFVYETVTCSAHCVSTSFPKTDTWHSNRKTKAPGKEIKLIYSTNPVISPRNYCTGQVKLNCWNCKQPLEKTSGFFCMSCKVVQPPDEGVSYFKILDCDYTFTLDTHKLQKRYLQLQRSLHPDNFSQKSVIIKKCLAVEKNKHYEHKEERRCVALHKEQEYSASHSALVNKAYQTLLKPLSRGLYMLELEGLHIEEGTDSAADSEFLMELMEINEALDEAQTPEEANKIGQDTKGKLAVLTEEIDAALLKGELQAAKALLAQMKYYANIEEKVKEKLSEFM